MNFKSNKLMVALVVMVITILIMNIVMVALCLHKNEAKPEAVTSSVKPN